MKIAVLIGSIRKNSYNKALAHHLKERYSDRLDLEILPIDKLPMFNEDIELTPPEIVIELRNKIKESDAILIVTPEYNYSVPGVLKNTLDWFSRVERVMSGKPSMVMGASQGRFGTVRCQAHLRQILNSAGIGTLNLPGNEVHISNVADKIDDAGKLIDESTIKLLDRRIDSFIQWINKVKQ